MHLWLRTVRLVLQEIGQIIPEERIVNVFEEPRFFCCQRLAQKFLVNDVEQPGFRLTVNRHELLHRPWYVRHITFRRIVQ